MLTMRKQNLFKQTGQYGFIIYYIYDLPCWNFQTTLLR